jgi:hypothetical protein
MGSRVFSPRLGTPQSIPRALEKTPGRPSTIYAKSVYDSAIQLRRLAIGKRLGDHVREFAHFEGFLEKAGYSLRYDLLGVGDKVVAR